MKEQIAKELARGINFDQEYSVRYEIILSALTRWEEQNISVVDSAKDALRESEYCIKRNLNQLKRIDELENKLAIAVEAMKYASKTGDTGLLLKAINKIKRETK